MLLCQYAPTSAPPHRLICRIREDTAKYLLNLDVNSAYYDPKTRSMRENPNPDKSADEISFAGDNFVRFSGDTKDFTKLSVFSWDVRSLFCLVGRTPYSLAYY